MTDHSASLGATPSKEVCSDCHGNGSLRYRGYQFPGLKCQQCNGTGSTQGKAEDVCVHLWKYKADDSYSQFWECRTCGDTRSTSPFWHAPSTVQPAVANLRTDQIFVDIQRRELMLSRTKFPGNEHLVVELLKEIGEVARAILEHGPGSNELLDKCAQTAALAQRIAIEGDKDFVPITADEEADSISEVVTVELCREDAEAFASDHYRKGSPRDRVSDKVKEALLAEKRGAQ